ncbi:multiple epidermal growth factor-like domains protein 11 [Pomacea canaliculata]|uniref:multiple epidermal growth factor-like domains protein 11 n=1 Tax=Pomacea canaliculata TaxID=400727 RepID=UPI000D72C228|nr:multiple epidermal growth factor-like domains protein 11 [Pomacea canaliculata]
MDRTTCTVDIDECSTNSSTCSGQQEVCTNTLGGYVCGCADGYQKNASNLCDVCATRFFGKDCSSICTCVTQNTVNCSNVDGACACKSGWRGKNCSEDVDECTQTPSLCVANSTCSNSPGSYRCVCNPGYKTLSDGSCTECTSYTYGTNCSSQCQCNATNTVSCHHVTGNCTCKQGWSGTTCNTDIDECASLNTHNCTRQQETCTNTLGGYRCTCNNGYQYNASMICTACSMYFFGKNCSSACTATPRTL